MLELFFPASDNGKLFSFQVTLLNKKHSCGLIHPPIYALLIMTLAGSAIAQTPSARDPAQHPKSAVYESLFNDKMLPLDSKLSWTKRFNGDETFNRSEMLPQPDSSGSQPVSSLSHTSEAATLQPHTDMDAIGVVKTLRISQGKVKISHGPIDKFGMPGMTMMFKVSDPSLLTNLKKGDRIGFNIDNNSGGFVITNVTPIDE